jgi:hypothetical protein
VAIAEDPLHPRPNLSLAQFAHRAEGQLVFDSVDVAAAVGPQGLEVMGVHPPRERPLDLLVDEPAPRDRVAMPCHPAAPEWADRHFEGHNPGREVPVAFEHPGSLPWRAEPLERPGTGVPGIGLLPPDRQLGSQLEPT